MELSLHEPLAAVRVCPVLAVPLIVGSAVFTGTDPLMTSAVWAELAGVDGPAAFDAVTVTRIVEPTSAWTTRASPVSS